MGAAARGQHRFVQLRLRASESRNLLLRARLLSRPAVFQRASSCQRDARGESVGETSTRKAGVAEGVVAKLEGTSWREWASGEAHEELARISGSLHKSVLMSKAALTAGVVVVTLGAGYLLANRDTVVVREVAELISQTKQDPQLQLYVQQFGRALLERVLSDEQVTRLSGEWIMGFLGKLQVEVGQWFVHILFTDHVLTGVNRLGDRIVAHLCSSAEIQNNAAQLMVNAICLDVSRDGAGQWAYDLILREDVQAGAAELVVSGLKTDAVATEAGNLTWSVVQALMEDPGIQEEVSHALCDIFGDADFMTEAKATLWGLMVPWRSAPAAPPGVLSALDDLISVDSLTPEERHVLRAVHTRTQDRVRQSPG